LAVARGRGRPSERRPGRALRRAARRPAAARRPRPRHKGFALALLVEALSSGLAGHGRADGPKEWGASVFLQLIDPGAFAGRDAFVRETQRLAEICHTTPVATGKPRVRLPGERVLARRAAQLAGGVALRHGIVESLRPWADQLGVGMPAPLA
jgi:LDH2 family malate/lactate/ureidoglycolate dehydrogenase